MFKFGGSSLTGVKVTTNPRIVIIIMRDMLCLVVWTNELILETNNSRLEWPGILHFIESF